MTYKPLLTDAQREELITRLSELAPDDILLSAMYDVMRFRDQVLADMAKISSKPKEIKPRMAVKKPDAATNVNVVASVEPDGEAAQRLSPKITSDILAMLAKQPLDLNTIAESINSSVANTQRVMKALWTRKLVFFDGNLYYKGK